MKILLIGLLAVQITSLSCTYGRHGQASSHSNSVSYLLRKICVEVTGLKEEVAGLKEAVTGFKEENLRLTEKVAGLEENVAGLEENVAGLEENVTGLEENVAGLEENVAGLEENVAGLEENVAGLEENVSRLEEENSAMKKPVDGNWAGWMQWSGCSNNCGPGTRTRQRQCLDPRPSNGGSDCPGSASETEECEITGCVSKVDGNWAGWMQWSGCSNNCGPGTRTRQRQCLDPRPSNGGSDCPGSASETEECEITGCVSKDPYSAFATYGILPTYQSPVLKWSSTTLNIATNNATHYNTSTGKYCPDHRGTYLFQLHLYKMSPTGGPSCTIIKESQSGSLASISRVFSSGSTLGGSTATIVELKQGDCVWVGACDDLLHISDLTSFSGALLDLLD